MKFPKIILIVFLFLLLAVGSAAPAEVPPLPPAISPLPAVKTSALHATSSKPAAQLSAKPVAVFAPPAWLTVTSSVPVMFMVSAALPGPFFALGLPTNRLEITTAMRQVFVRSRIDSFPAMNFPITAAWTTNALAVRYRIYVGSAPRSYSQVIEVPPTNSWTTSIWQCLATNYLAMTCFDAAGVESALSAELQYQPAVELKISK